MINRHTGISVGFIVALTLTLAVVFSVCTPAHAAADATVFAGPAAQPVAVLREGVPTAGGPLRVLSVEERVGVQRTQAMVRVPLFFHPGECADPNQLALYEQSDTQRAHPIAYQADDIRRSDDGKVARMHIYFFTDLKPWQHRKFVLYPGTNVASKLGDIKMTETGDTVTFDGDALKITLMAKGPKAGGITLIQSPFAKITAKDNEVLAPFVKLSRQDEKLKTTRTNEIKYDNPASFQVRSIKYATGPLFAKVQFVVSPPNVPDLLETTYLLPRYSSEIVATLRMLPEEQNTPETVFAKWPVVLWGHCTFGDDPATPTVIDVPAGLRELTANTHGFTAGAAASTKAGFSFLNAPYIAWGNNTVYTHENGELVFMGPGTMGRGGASNSGTLRAWWYQARYVLAPTTDKQKLYDLARANFQSLTAVVDEPGLTVDDFATLVKPVGQAFFEIKYWGRGWQQTAVMQYLIGDDAAFEKSLNKVANAGPPKEGKADDTMLEGWMPKWALEQVAAGKTIPLDRPKGSDRDVAGKLDPYGLGYGAGSIPVFARFFTKSDRLSKICYAAGKGSMLTNAGVYPNGFPRINAFSNAYNMQIGTIMFALVGGQSQNDTQLLTFVRDVTRSPGAIAIYGRGQRCYSGDVRNVEPSDVLYQAISDTWLRVSELLSNEDLMIHPATYGRYVDAVDVMADLQHHGLNNDDGSDRHANFFRTQCHDHRWEAWETAPFAMIFRDADNPTSPVGLTDALYYLQRQGGRKQNWSGLMHYFHPLAAMRFAMPQYQPVALPALPANVQVKPAAKGVTVTWAAVPGDIAGYRVYRAPTKGDPLYFVNSPYRNTNNELITATHYNDADGSPTDFYFITAVTKDGHESRWFPDEPTPVAGKK